jgi:hypothetical protein
MLNIKTIQYRNLPLKTRYLFLKHLQRNVHEFALNRQDEFPEKNNTAEHFHRDKQKVRNSQSRMKNKAGVLIHALNQNGYFALRAYTPPAMETLNQYHKILSEIHPEWTTNCIESTESCALQPTEKTAVYESLNWLPYRDCTVKNGIFYDTEKNKIADFDNRIKGNVASFLRTILGENTPQAEIAKKSIKILQIIPQKQTRIALLSKDKEIKKHPFKIQFSIHYQLPTTLSLGQNAAYGNGVFRQIN